LEIDEDKAQLPATRGDVVIMAALAQRLTALCRALNAKLSVRDDDTDWIKAQLIKLDEALTDEMGRLVGKDPD
jgi:hypothetical protein